MPFNVLLLPLLGGYLFITHWNRTRFATKRYSGERLIFHSAIAGVFFLALSFVVVQSVIALWPASYRGWRSIMPFPYTGTSFGAFFLGTVAWLPLNRWVFKLEAEQRRVIAEWGDHLEELLEKAMRETKLVAISMKSGKVYVGFPTSNINPAYDRKFLQLLPSSSGFREPDTQEVVFTTDYARVYLEMVERGTRDPESDEDKFLVVLPVSEVASANIFDPEAFALFNSVDPADSSSAEDSDTTR